MDKTEINVAGFPADDIEKVDFSVEKGCLLLVLKNGDVVELHVRN